MISKTVLAIVFIWDNTEFTHMQNHVIKLLYNILAIFQAA